MRYVLVLALVGVMGCGGDDPQQEECWDTVVAWDGRTHCVPAPYTGSPGYCVFVAPESPAIPEHCGDFSFSRCPPGMTEISISWRVLEGPKYWSDCGCGVAEFSARFCDGPFVEE